MNNKEIIEEEPKRPKFSRGKPDPADDGLGENWVRIALGLRDDLLKKWVHTIDVFHIVSP